MTEQKNIERLAELIKKSKSTVFFGGAGVSTESGVKDYRSEDGLYNTVREYGVPPETILSRSFFERNPETFYDFYRKYFIAEKVKPNAAHTALAELEKRGLMSAVITQNIDGLHQLAGSKNVLELHGTIFKYHCSRCQSEYGIDFLERTDGVPRCEKCGGIVKPDVVLYEEPLDGDVMSRAVREISKAELLIIGGTSLAVYPAAGLLMYFTGKNIVLINKGEPPYDGRADLVFRESIGGVLGEAARLAIL